jgi:hypothetical protein
MRMTCECDDLVPGATTIVNVTEATADGEALTGATCTATVYSTEIAWTNGVPAGTVVTNGGPISGTEEADGAYRVVLPATIGITLGATYRVLVMLSKSGVGQQPWTITKVAKEAKGG